MSDVITIPMRASRPDAKNNIIEALFGNTKVYLQSLIEYFKEPRNTPATLLSKWWLR